MTAEDKDIIERYEAQIKPRGEDEVWEYRTHGVYRQNRNVYLYELSKGTIKDAEATEAFTLDLHIPVYNKETRGFYKDKDQFYHMAFFEVYLKILIALNPHWTYNRILRFMFTLRKIVTSNFTEKEIQELVIMVLDEILHKKTIDFHCHYPFEHKNMIAKNKEGVKELK